MLENEKQTAVDQRIYSDLMIYICTLLGGILLADYMVSHNFKILGQREKVAPTWIIAIVASLSSLIFAILTPNMSLISDFYLSLLTSLIVIYIVRRIQGKSIAQYFENGGQSYRWTRGALLLGIWYAIMLTIVIILIVFDIDI